MRIVVVGPGAVGRALGGGWWKAGHEIAFVARDRASANARAAQALGAAFVDPGATAGFDAIVLAVPWEDVPRALQSLGPIEGRLLIDVTNPIEPPYTALAATGGESGAEIVARLAAGARVVKAFSICAWETMADSRYPEGPPLMPVAGNDAAARRLVIGLARDLGFDAIDAGALDAARLLEPLAMLWIRLSRVQGFGRDFAFRLTRR